MTLSFLERSASNRPATRRASGPMPAPRTLAPTSVGAPMRLTVFMPGLWQFARGSGRHQALQQFPQLDRFDQVRIEAGLLRGLAVQRLAPSRQRDEADAA